jgi:hypothetical protein
MSAGHRPCLPKYPLCQARNKHGLSRDVTESVAERSRCSEPVVPGAHKYRAIRAALARAGGLLSLSGRLASTDFFVARTGPHPVHLAVAALDPNKTKYVAPRPNPTDPHPPAHPARRSDPRNPRTAEEEPWASPAEESRAVPPTRAQGASDQTPCRPSGLRLRGPERPRGVPAWPSSQSCSFRRIRKTHRTHKLLRIPWFSPSNG